MATVRNTCSVCYGSGRVTKTEIHNMNHITRSESCMACWGRGYTEYTVPDPSPPSPPAKRTSKIKIESGSSKISETNQSPIADGIVWLISGIFRLLFNPFYSNKKPEPKIESPQKIKKALEISSESSGEKLSSDIAKVSSRKENFSETKFESAKKNQTESFNPFDWYKSFNAKVDAFWEGVFELIGSFFRFIFYPFFKKEKTTPKDALKQETTEEAQEETKEALKELQEPAPEPSEQKLFPFVDKWADKVPAKYCHILSLVGVLIGVSYAYSLGIPLEKSWGYGITGAIGGWLTIPIFFIALKLTLLVAVAGCVWGIYQLGKEFFGSL